MILINRSTYIDENDEQPFYHIVVEEDNTIIYSKMTDSKDDVTGLVEEAMEALWQETPKQEAQGRDAQNAGHR